MRNYKRKRNPRGRMLRAVELRAQGLSLRKIAEELAVTHPTVLADLRRWDREHLNVTPLVVNHDGKSLPPGGENLPPESTTEPGNVVPLRRMA